MDCGADPGGSLKEMFVDIVQAGRINRGQRPALRPVFQKVHGVARGAFRIRPDLPDDLRIGFLAGKEYPAWVRFSSDTDPSVADYKTTIGVAFKLFGVPGDKLVGDPAATTVDIVMQNHDVFFVSTARDMCEFTRAGVIEGDYDAYLARHPRTARILDNMAKPEASVLGASFWSILPFALGAGRAVKYKLEPTEIIAPLSDSPADPRHLATDLASRLTGGPAVFRFCLQFQSDPAAMPIDDATTPWDETVSPPVHVADLILERQDIEIDAQAGYGENLAMNIWRTTPDHAPLGSLAAARREAYAASADQRRRVNGVSTDEPAADVAGGRTRDDVVVRAAIHPGIGVARVGDSVDEFFVGPETPAPPAPPSGGYRDATGALKRQAARFRIYGYNAAGKVVREVTADDADIEWRVHLANKKAAWYRFLAALDVPEAATMKSNRRNAAITGAGRSQLVVDPGPRHIWGRDQRGPDKQLDSGRFKTVPVSLGEIRTDDQGRLLVLGGTGKSASPGHSPPYIDTDPDSFNNADDWYDDIADGPVDAVVRIEGRDVPVEGAWVTVAPPNYAPHVVGWRTLYDLLVDLYVTAGWLETPKKVSFGRHIQPILSRLSNLQWVNAGFSAMFGADGPMNFEDPALLAKLRRPRTADDDPYAELRQQLFNAFRPASTTVEEPRLWPWLYGDAYGSFGPTSPRNSLSLPTLQASLLQRWAKGDFVDDVVDDIPAELDAAALAEQPILLDQAALHFCLADAFHPGCELTWPMRHISLYSAPFRIRRRPAGEDEKDYGPSLDQAEALALDGPLNGQGPGDLTRWMALPWQGDTAYCRSGYEARYDPYLPTFWPARVPNQVLTEGQYRIAIDTARPRSERIAAYHRRESWVRAIDEADTAAVMERMIAEFGAMGLVEARPGVVGDPDLPDVMYVENIPQARVAALAASAERAGLARPVDERLARAGWKSEEQFQAFRAVRVRDR